MRHGSGKASASIILLLALIGLFSVVGHAQEISVLLVGYPAQLVQYVRESVAPDFEARTGAKANIVTTTWNERTSKIMIQIAGGVPFDVVTTGAFTPYEEGSQNMLEPLDKYLSKWPNAKRYPKQVWEALKWNGEVMTIPNNFDLRGIVYNKALFAENGYDGNTTPNSWEELVSYAKRLTRVEGDKVTVRGLDLWWKNAPAQVMFWFMRQAGVPEMDPNTLNSNLSSEEAVAALQLMVDVYEASMGNNNKVGGGFVGGNHAMEVYSPTILGHIKKGNPELLDDIGVFAPQRYPDSTPVSHAFINGLAISQASENKDLAWEFIKLINSDEHLLGIMEVAGWITGRTDLVRQAVAIQPKIDLWYNIMPYLQNCMIPPPRNTAQQEVNKLVKQALNRQIAPRTAVEQADRVWQPLIADWKEQLGR